MLFPVSKKNKTSHQLTLKTEKHNFREFFKLLWELDQTLTCREKKNAFRSKYFRCCSDHTIWLWSPKLKRKWQVYRRLSYGTVWKISPETISRRTQNKSFRRVRESVFNYPALMHVKLMESNLPWSVNECKIIQNFYRIRTHRKKKKKWLCNFTFLTSPWPITSRSSKVVCERIKLNRTDVIA